MSNNRVLSFKLASGEEIIARHVREEPKHMVVSKPRVVIVQQTGPKTLGIVGLVPWMITSPDGDIRVRIDSIVGEPDTDLAKNIEDAYLQETSGIDLSSKIDPRS